MNSICRLSMLWLTFCLVTFCISCTCGDDDDDDSSTDDDTGDDDVVDDDVTDDDIADDDTGVDDDDTGTEIFNENFDSMTVGLPPEPPWTTAAVGGTALVSNTFPSKSGSGNVVDLDKTGTTGSDYVILAYTFTPALTTDFSYSADVYFDTTAVSGFRLWSDPTMANWDQCVYSMDYVEGDGFLITHSWDGLNFLSVPCTELTRGEWATFRVAIDWAGKTSTTWVNGVVCAADVPFWQDTNTQVTSPEWVLLSGTPAGHMYVDNVSVLVWSE